AQQLVPAARAGDREVSELASSPQSTAPHGHTADERQRGGGVTAPERAIKWSYMDHWRSNGPAGPVDQWHSHKTMSAFLKQIKAVGFDAIDTFDFRLWQTR